MSSGQNAESDPAATVGRRTHRRVDCQLAARVFLDELTLVRCVVENLSHAGARVRLQDDLDVPKRLTLLIEAPVQRSVYAEVRWRVGRVLGLHLPHDHIAIETIPVADMSFATADVPGAAGPIALQEAAAP